MEEQKELSEDFTVVKRALEKANQRGVFTLEESAIVFNAVQLHERSVNKTREQLAELYKREESRKNAIKEPKSK